MIRRKTRRSRWMALNVVSIVLSIVLAVFVFVRRGEDGSGDAFAAPAGPGARMTIGDAGASGADGAVAPGAPASGSVAEQKPKGDKDERVLGASDAPDPIDLAISPDGGVPFHPGGGRYRSPFAQPGAGSPAIVKVGFLLNSIDGYDVKSGTFSADFFLSLTSSITIPPVTLQFPNGKLESREVIADKPSFKLVRLTGTFKSPADLRKYPFDQQELKIVIEDDMRGIDQLRFVADHDRTQLARGFRAVGWSVTYVEGRTLEQTYPDRFENDDLFYSRYTFCLGVERYATSAAFKVFVPAFVIVLISLLGMWVPPEEMEVRSNSGAPMLAGAVLFHFALMQELPATSYLSRADKLMLGVYVSLVLGMVSTWWMFLVKEHNVVKVFRIARVLVPALSVIAMALACVV